MFTFKFKRGHGFTESDCGRATVTNNAQMSCNDDNTKGWDLHLDGEFEGTFKTRKEAVEHAQLVAE